jgi:hypothetical protein
VRIREWFRDCKLAWRERYGHTLAIALVGRLNGNAHPDPASGWALYN